MLKKFALWFICFGLSFLIASWGWTEQGKAFLLIDLTATGAIIIFIIVVCIFALNKWKERLGVTAIPAVIYAVIIAITLFATWVATKLFDVDFYITYQIMTFGQCLVTSQKDSTKKSDD